MSPLANQSILMNDKNHRDEQEGMSCVSVWFPKDGFCLSVVLQGNDLMSQAIWHFQALPLMNS